MIKISHALQGSLNTFSNAFRRQDKTKAILCIGGLAASASGIGTSIYLDRDRLFAHNRYCDCDLSLAEMFSPKTILTECLRIVSILSGLHIAAHMREATSNKKVK